MSDELDELKEDEEDFDPKKLKTPFNFGDEEEAEVEPDEEGDDADDDDEEEEEETTSFSDEM